MIDPMASLSIPTAHGLIDTNTVRQTEVIFSVVVEVGDKVINQLPSVLLGRFGISRSRRLVTPPHCPEQVIKSVLRHPSEAKVRWLQVDTLMGPQLTTSLPVAEVNSNFVINKMTPKNFNISLQFVLLSSNLVSSVLVSSTISMSCFGGNIRRKNPVESYH